MRLPYLIISICLYTATSSAIANGKGKPVLVKSDKITDLRSAISLTEFENMTVDSNDDIPSQAVNETVTDINYDTMHITDRLRIIEERINNDDDTDGFSIAQGDCDDTDSSTYPNAFEATDGIDNNCDGIVDNKMVQR